MELRIFVEPQQGATYEEQLAAARVTEQAGLDGFFRSDHLHPIGERHREGIGPTDSWVTLAALARETERVRLGTLMTSATFRHPGVLAIEVAEVDQMSAGRIELGIGAGWFKTEHQAYGVPFGASVGERFSRLTEQLEILTGIWSTPQGQFFDYPGEHYQLEHCPALPKPCQSSIPIIIGGRGTVRTPRLAARFAAELNLPFQGVDQARELFSYLDAACEREGRDPASVVRSVALTTAVGSDHAEAERRAANIGREFADLVQGGLAGTPEEVAGRIAAYRAIGVTRIYCQCLDVCDLEHIALIGSAVAPLVQ